MNAPPDLRAGRPPVSSTRQDRVVVVRLDRPEKLNAFSAEGYRALARSLTDADADPDVHVVLVEGAGRAFSAGADLDALQTGDPADFRDGFTQMLDTLVHLSIPLVAAVHGVAVGIGATLLLHCDVVVAADDARLRYPFTALGTAPEAGSSWLLPATVGAQRAAEIIMSSRWVTAQEALRYGLVSELVPPDGLTERAGAVAAEIAQWERPGLVAAKRLLRESQRAAVPLAVDRELSAGHELTQQLGLVRRRR